jgi:hypothetical protein
MNREQLVEKVTFAADELVEFYRDVNYHERQGKSVIDNYYDALDDAAKVTAAAALIDRRSRPMIGRHSGAKLEKLEGAVKSALAHLSNFDRFGTSVDLLEAHTVDAIRQCAAAGTRCHNIIEYGGLDRKVATGRAICRSCGQKIQKGEPALTFGWDFQGSGSYTAAEVQIHEGGCEPLNKRIIDLIREAANRQFGPADWKPVREGDRWILPTRNEAGDEVIFNVIQTERGVEFADRERP